MRLLDNVVLALRRLRHRPVRSLLLLQGTIWGVAVALFPSAVIQGTRAAMRLHGSDIGVDRVTMALDTTGVDPTPLTVEDVEVVRAAALAAGCEVKAADGLQVLATSKGSKDPNVPSAILAGGPGAPAARGLVLAEGRLLDPAATSAEAVVEAELAQALTAGTSGASALGKAIALPDGSSAKVVGVLAARPPQSRRTNDIGIDTGHPVFQNVTGRLLIHLGVPFGDDGWKRTDRCAYVLRKDSKVDWIYLRVRTEELKTAASASRNALLARGKGVVAFYPLVPSLILGREIDRFQSVNLALFLSCLLMGGVVMANVGLLAALRRAPEIAVHRVEGASRRDIATQFIVEGLVLALVGTLIGFVLACGLATLRVSLEAASGMTWTFPWKEASVTTIVAVVVGVLASALPAARAALMEPVEALTDE